jgi:hypothetical protein
LRPAYFNFFNHRLHTLLHQGWRKYRYYRRFQPGATDGFSRYIFALIGLDDAQLRGATPLPWSRLLSFVGMIASRSRSPGMVAGMIAHCFDLEQAPPVFAGKPAPTEGVSRCLLTKAHVHPPSRPAAETGPSPTDSDLTN